MIRTIYVEEAAFEHKTTKHILGRFKNATVIPCEHYGEVFNPKAQNFRLQKKQPSLILAKKKGEPVLPTPPSYGIGDPHNYYFAHMLNCIYDCRYCFLQGMYRSAALVVFVNDNDFFSAIQNALERHTGETVGIFSGYDCDSLALDHLTGFTKRFLPFFRAHENATLELRTKSVQIQNLLKEKPLSNAVVAFTLSPENVVTKVEHGTPRLKSRLQAMKKLAAKGWMLGLRFDPIVAYPGYQQDYLALFEEVFQTLPKEYIHSITTGTFRVPKSVYKNMLRHYPKDQVLHRDVIVGTKHASYSSDRSFEIVDFTRAALKKRVSEDILFIPQVATAGKG